MDYYYYIITYSLIVSGQIADSGLCGVQSSIPDHLPNRVKRTILDANRDKFHGRIMDVFINEKQKVTKEVYEQQAQSFSYTINGTEK